jgi:DNA-binding PucR family transcriptional regulator
MMSNEVHSAAIGVLLAAAALPMKIAKAEIIEEITEMIAHEVEHLDDPELVELLRASVGDNITMLTHLLTKDITLDRMQPAPMPIEYAMRLAQRGVPSQSLRRAYHRGEAQLVDTLFLHIQELESSPEEKLLVMHRAAMVMSSYFDWITQHVMQAYEDERERWLDASTSVRTRLIHQFLAAPSPDTGRLLSQETGYDLDQYHVGVVAWTRRGGGTASLDTGVNQLAKALGARGAPLILPVDHSSIWAWLPRGRDSAAPDLTDARALLATGASTTIAVGLAAPGGAGFALTHAQAIDAQRVVAYSTEGHEGIVAYSDRGIGALAMLSRDLDGTRRWVGEQLGALAEAGESNARLRETLRVFLQEGSSYARAADSLMLHRNTIQYRINKAVDQLERPLTAETRLEIELALEACYRLGLAVARQAGT